jgi:DNA (cytosine-5)-methyltransferase 1
MADAELIENADLIPGETPPNPEDSSAEDIPVRVLDDFTIYEWDTLQLIPITELLRLKSRPCYGASGFVKPWADDTTDDDSIIGDETGASSPPQILKLSPILELNVHHFSSGSGCLDM